MLLERFGERAVSLVDVEVVLLEKIVGDVDVGPAVAVHICDADTESEADLAAEDARRVADVDEALAVVAVELVTAVGVAFFARIARTEAANRPRRVVDNEEIEIAVAIVVEEGGVRRVSPVGDAESFAHLFKMRNAVFADALVDPERICTALRLGLSGMRDVDVESTIAVHVGDRHPRGPHGVLSEPGQRRDVAKAELPFVEIQPSPALVRRQDEFGEAIAGEVTDCDTAAVVEIAVGEDIRVDRLAQTILEAHAGVRCRHAREQLAIEHRRLRGLIVAGGGNRRP